MGILVRANNGLPNYLTSFIRVDTVLVIIARVVCNLTYLVYVRVVGSGTRLHVVSLRVTGFGIDVMNL